ncbi:MAG: hydroxymethylbilane synthase, partial [Planctomycetes bacterium]|nr:hydroxymethylbilane synthase [Planctomycetota bacterium]
MVREPHGGARRGPGTALPRPGDRPRRVPRRPARGRRRDPGARRQGAAPAPRPIAAPARGRRRVAAGGARRRRARAPGPLRARPRRTRPARAGRVPRARAVGRRHAHARRGPRQGDLERPRARRPQPRPRRHAARRGRARRTDEGAAQRAVAPRPAHARLRDDAGRADRAAQRAPAHPGPQGEGVRVIVLGSRTSELALTQTRAVAELLRAATGCDCRIETMETVGDKVLERPLAAIGTKGAFTAELEDALRAGRIDAAVHSLKDLPVDDPPGLVLGAVPERVDTADVLLIRPEAVAAGAAPGAIPLRQGARVGTSSPRRCLSLQVARPDLQFADIRGNVGTRAGKVLRGDYDAAVFAAAGLDRLRLDLQGLVRWQIPVDLLPPAPGQGALAVQCRADDERTRGLLQRIHDEDAARCVAAERALLAALGGGCSLPLGALAQATPQGCRMTAALFGGTPAAVLRAAATGPDFAAVVAELAAPWLPLIGAPLQGQRVALLRIDGDGGDLAAALAIAGARVVPVALTRAIDLPAEPQAVAAVAAAPALAFASARAVERFRTVLGTAGLACRAAQVFAIGPTTAAAARALGLPVHVADGSGGSALAGLAARSLPRGSRIGFPCAADRNPGFEAGAAAAGLLVLPLPLYRVEADPAPALPPEPPP